MSNEVTNLMRLRCPKSDGPTHFRIDIHLPLSIDALGKLTKRKGGILTCACGAEMVVRHGGTVAPDVLGTLRSLRANPPSASAIEGYGDGGTDDVHAVWRAAFDRAIAEVSRG